MLYCVLLYYNYNTICILKNRQLKGTTCSSVSSSWYAIYTLRTGVCVSTANNFISCNHKISYCTHKNPVYHHHQHHQNKFLNCRCLFWEFWSFSFKVKFYVLTGPCHHGMASPQVADGGTSPIRRVAANKLNKQSRRTDKGWSSSARVWARR